MTSPLWHPFTQHGLKQEIIPVERAEGAYLYTQDGRRIIDAISSWWVVTHGHCHPKIVEAVRAQAGTLDQVIFAGFTHDPAEELAETLLSFAPDNLSHVFFSDSGSTAVEVALKMAIGYWAQTGKARRKVLALEGGYHGDTFGAMSAGARSVYNRMYEPYLFEVTHLPFPAAGEEGRTLEALETFLRAHGDDTAAFIFEPLVLGAGGMLFYTPEVLSQMAEMCRAHGVLLIA
ncbi:MAG: aminotransferase class III-fold pyridoxal phosphate-dependent enzyme, partial [Alphaproteobacteria bacterium]|nr:aminotransferase class III-fold pyridoxal phosphate-dependent enzyme [Alphaproteobacteria bacterium]